MKVHVMPFFFPELLLFILSILVFVLHLKSGIDQTEPFPVTCTSAESPFLFSYVLNRARKKIVVFLYLVSRVSHVTRNGNNGRLILRQNRQHLLHSLLGITAF